MATKVRYEVVMDVWPAESDTWSPDFMRNLLPSSSLLYMAVSGWKTESEALGESMVITYHITRCQHTDDHSLKLLAIRQTYSP